MNKIVGVRFKSAGKVYSFASDGLEINEGDHVIVETTRGIEYGKVMILYDDSYDPKKLETPLKKVMRIATEMDSQKYHENLGKRDEALKACQEKINKHGLTMKLIDVEFTFDNSKVIFYFTSDNRVDFRELVKDLAIVFRTRIELRQIGVRDESKILGGIGNCGKELCCHSWMREFEPVSIKMAKVQNLSLNPTKISGICGRLMCCLKYENEVYKLLRKGLPEMGEKVKVEGEFARVVSTSVLHEMVKVRYILSVDENNSEKLSDDVYAYDKNEVQSMNRRQKDHQETPISEVKESGDLLDI